VTEDFFQSESGKGTNLDSEKTKIKKRESKKIRIKVADFVGTLVANVSILIQMTTGFSACSVRNVSTKYLEMRWL
jgi:hypothetical protein